MVPLELFAAAVLCCQWCRPAAADGYKGAARPARRLRWSAAHGARTADFPRNGTGESSGILRRHFRDIRREISGFVKLIGIDALQCPLYLAYNKNLLNTTVNEYKMSTCPTFRYPICIATDSKYVLAFLSVRPSTTDVSKELSKELRR